MSSDYVDLIYLDPPFNSKRAYNVIYPDDESQATAFTDTWYWTPETDDLLKQIKLRDFKTYQILNALIQGLGKAQICAYLVNMAVRLVEMKRVLKSTGSLYLHCDPAASHYLKIVMDRIFGEKNFRNEIVWHYPSMSRTKQDFPRKHDIVLRYSKTDVWVFNLDDIRIPYTKSTVSRAKYGGAGFTGKSGKANYLNADGKIPDTVWHIPHIKGKERTGYPTQKPLKLLERIIKASSNKGDLVLDPFCGCGTTIVAAELLNRQWIGIDITYTAIRIVKDLLKRNSLLQTWKQTSVYGEPKTMQEIDARLLKPSSALARKEFEKFCVVSVGGFPNEKMGADGGIDGRIPLKNNNTAIVSVKSGRVGVSQLRDLNGILNHRNKVGIFITKERPTAPMVEFANQAGSYQANNLVDKSVPRLQIIELEELLRGKQPVLQ